MGLVAFSILPLIPMSSDPFSSALDVGGCCAAAKLAAGPESAIAPPADGGGSAPVLPLAVSVLRDSMEVAGLITWLFLAVQLGQT